MTQQPTRSGQRRNWGGLAIGTGAGAAAGTATHSFWVGAASGLVMSVIFFFAFNRARGRN